VAEAVVRLSGPAAGRAAALTAGQGRLARDSDGGYLWRVSVANETLFAMWVARSGPGVRVLEPFPLADRVRTGLAEVVRLHG
jgi:predicted DNA-binding transcriptional regulator YafY